MSNPITIATSSLAGLFPHLAAEYHRTNALPPNQVHPLCDDPVWWSCANDACGHEWLAPPVSRCGGAACPRCGSPHWPSTIPVLACG